MLIIDGILFNLNFKLFEVCQRFDPYLLLSVFCKSLLFYFIHYFENKNKLHKINKQRVFISTVFD